MMDAQSLLVEEETLDADEDPDDVVAYRVVRFNRNNETQLIPQVSTAPSYSSAPTVQTVLANPVTVNGVSGLYVIGTSNGDVYNTDPMKKQIAPRTGRIFEGTTTNTEPVINYRDDKRRATHNEIERRRRVKINNWIMKLGNIIPECSLEVPNSKGGGYEQSKGGILAKACEYILELRESNKRLMDVLRENEQLSADLMDKTKENDQLLRENKELKSLLSQYNVQRFQKKK